MVENSSVHANDQHTAALKSTIINNNNVQNINNANPTFVTNNNVNILMTKDDLKDFSEFYSTLEDRINQKIKVINFENECILDCLAKHMFRGEDNQPYVAIGDLSRKILVSRINGKINKHTMDQFHETAEINDILFWMTTFIQQKQTGDPPGELRFKSLRNRFHGQNKQEFNKSMIKYTPKLNSPKHSNLTIDLQA